ncbi:hypothetical protein PROFUN_12051 [Planoprotostelium fungivorum]|uniref:Uncharacterized protein n=1 Tax=Planoprotostelium fungivorum TaxID=1890364 RepID=A0A2P6MXK6_9EUKA|nr:hypothetical protein PROFUN_12051 [Planoprotostelium fungivorum]
MHPRQLDVIDIGVYEVFQAMALEIVMDSPFDMSVRSIRLCRIDSVQKRQEWTKKYRTILKFMQLMVFCSYNSEAELSIYKSFQSKRFVWWS